MCVYNRPPKNKNIENVFKHFCDTMTLLTYNHYKKIIFYGDLSIHFLDNTCKYIKIIILIMSNYNLKPTSGILTTYYFQTIYAK